jgi:hypothetical protein
MGEDVALVPGPREAALVSGIQRLVLIYCSQHNCKQSIDKHRHLCLKYLKKYIKHLKIIKWRG